MINPISCIIAGLLILFVVIIAFLSGTGLTRSSQPSVPDVDNPAPTAENMREEIERATHHQQPEAKTRLLLMDGDMVLKDKDIPWLVPNLRQGDIMRITNWGLCEIFKISTTVFPEDMLIQVIQVHRV